MQMRFSNKISQMCITIRQGCASITFWRHCGIAGHPVQYGAVFQYDLTVSVHLNPLLGFDAIVWQPHYVRRDIVRPIEKDLRLLCDAFTILWITLGPTTFGTCVTTHHAIVARRTRLFTTKNIQIFIYRSITFCYDIYKVPIQPALQRQNPDLWSQSDPLRHLQSFWQFWPYILWRHPENQYSEINYLLIWTKYT